MTQLSLALILQLCGPGVATNFSEAIVDMPLLRVGCDGVIDSGSLNINSACPCDTAVCPDCADIQGGGKCYMSHVMRKPVLMVSDQVRHKPCCTST